MLEWIALAPIIDPYLVSQFESFGDMSLTIARISVLILVPIRPYYWVFNFFIYFKARLSHC